MKASQFFISTLKEAPAEAALASHKLMLRAGLIKANASGLYTWMPMGLRVLRKVEAIVREEMNRAGAIELLMPVVQPADLWKESGRWDFYGDELLRITDRHDNAFCFSPTCEELITDIVRKEINSYKQLPKNFYHIQTKFRDERRPRFGVMRAREFVMKDAYSFHADFESLKATYQTMYDAYCRIFNRLGLDYRPVAADTGSIGGTGSHEFQVLADSGEDVIAYSDASDYAANVELAQTLPLSGCRVVPAQALAKIHTPIRRKVKEHLRQIKGQLDIHKLHLEAEFANFLLADRTCLTLFRMILLDALEIRCVRQPVHCTQIRRHRCIRHRTRGAHHTPALHSARCLDDYVIPLRKGKFTLSKRIYLARRLKADTYNRLQNFLLDDLYETIHMN